MEQLLLIADADGCLPDLYLKYFAAHGYSVRVASGGVQCLTALRDSTPDVLMLDSELKWGGADGVLAVMDEDDDLSTIPIVLLNDADGMDAVNQVSLLLAVNSCRRFLGDTVTRQHAIRGVDLEIPSADKNLQVS